MGASTVAKKPNRGRSWPPSLRPALVAVTVGLLVAGGLSVYALETSQAPSSGPPTPPGEVPPGGPPNANLTGPTAPAILLTHGRLGVDVRADVPLTSASSDAMNATGVQLVRWPGGALGDRFDPIADGGVGVIYGSAGTPSTPDVSFQGFVDWCRSLHCESIVTLPAEINNASLAAAIVQYSIGTLAFHPTYWEIGNEPELWMHYNIPWTSWNATQNVNATPAQFALVAHAYVAAIRSVDPVTPIIGIGGIGAGPTPQSTWIDDVVMTNGPNLSGVAIHVYPAGEVLAPQPPAEWFASLLSGSSLPGRVNGTVANLAKTCPGCNLTVFVDELGSGTLVPVGDEIGGGYLASYVSAEIVQSLPLSLGTIAYYNLQSATPGSWFSTAGAPSPAYFAYAEWSARIGPYAAPLGVSSSASGLLAAVGGAAAGSLPNLILVNANSSYTFSVNLSTTFPDVASARILYWNGAASSPENLTWEAGGPTPFDLPPMSLAIFTGVGTYGHSLRPAPGVQHLARPHAPTTRAPVELGPDLGRPGTPVVAAARIDRGCDSARLSREPRGANAPAIARRCGQVALVSPVPF